MTITLGQVITICVASLALIVSLFSLGVSALNYRRDNAKLKSKCAVQRPWSEQEDEYDPSFRVTMVNAGRRPIILTTIGGSKSGGISTYMKSTDGIRLGEGEAFDYSMTEFDFINTDPEGNVHEWEELWIQDSVGNRYLVPNSRKKIAEFHTAIRELRQRRQR